ncbi:MAG: hypothetical protein ABR955_04145 [Verrucomicrobiota bacterium]|jgi:hypothetical protein
MNVSQNAKFALVIASKPEFHNPLVVEPDRNWREFLYDVRQREVRSKVHEKIHENVWQISLNDEMPFLVYLMEQAAQRNIPLHTLFLDAELDWIRYPKSAESKPSKDTP